MGKIVYVITHKNLAKGYRGPQCAHALGELIAFGRENKRILNLLFFTEEEGKLVLCVNDWFEKHKTICFLAVPNLEELKELNEFFKKYNLHVWNWHEPDMNNELTAFAIEPVEAGSLDKYLGTLPLA